jgi:hypothetical protein
VNQPAPAPPNPRPDVTPAQVLAVLGWVGAQAVAWGWLDAGTAQLAVSAGATLVALGWKLSDAIIRNGRSRHPLPTPPAG